MHQLIFFNKQRNSMTPSKRLKTPRSGHPKFKNLRKRLQYKKKKEGTPALGKTTSPNEEQPVPGEEQAIPAEQQSTQEGDQVIQDEDKDILDEDHAVPKNSKKRLRKQNHFNRASPMKVVRLYKSMNISHCTVIRNNLWASFLDIKCSRLQPELCNFIMDSFNSKTCQLEFPGRGNIPINEQVVIEVLGCPRGRFPVVYQQIAQATEFVMEMFGFGNGKQPKLSEIEELLISMKEGDDKYLSLWVLYVASSILAPTTGVRVSPKLYPAIMDPSKIKDLNWPRFIIMILNEAANGKGKNNAFKACMLFLMVKYIDSLETNHISVRKDVARICAWDNKSVVMAMEQDTNPDGSFGRLPLKECFREKRVMFSTPAKIEKFVKANIPPNCSQEELGRYTKAAQEMYSEIDLAVGKFLRKVTSSTSLAEEVELNEAAKPTDKVSNRTVRKGNRTIHDSDSDGEFKCTDDGYESEGEDTSLDEESFACNEEGDNSSDDDFMTVRKKRKVSKPTVCEKREPLRRNKPRKVNIVNEKIVSPIQRRVHEEFDAHRQYTEFGANEATVDVCMNLKADGKLATETPATVPNTLSVNVVGVDQKLKGSNVEDVAQQQYAVFGANKADGGANEKVAAVLSNVVGVEQKLEGSNGDVIEEVAAVPNIVPVNVVGEEKKLNGSIVNDECQPVVSATQVGTILIQANNDSEQQVESKTVMQKPIDIKVAHGALQQLMLYDSGSQSSNDSSMLNFQSGPRTAFSTTQAVINRPCFNHEEDGTSVHAIRQVTDSCVLNTLSDARNMQSKVEGSVLCQRKAPLTAKKSVSWADKTTTDFARRGNQQQVSSVLPVNSQAPAPIPAQKAPFVNESPIKIARRPVTRSMSPSKASSSPLFSQKENITPSPKSRMNLAVSTMKEGKLSGSLGEVQAATVELVKRDSTFARDSMNKRLDFESIRHDDPRRRWLPGEAPSFDLGFDDIELPEQDTAKLQTKKGIPIITSSNEDLYYGPAEEYEKLADKLGEGFFKTETCISKPTCLDEKRGTQIQSTAAQETPTNKSDMRATPQIYELEDIDSKTPVPQAHQKRLLRAGKTQQSPFVQYSKKNSVTVPKDAVELYNAICQHGKKSDSELKNNMIIDYGSTFVFTPDLADSVSPGNWLSNSTCEVALHVLSKELAPQRKFVMSLNTSNKLREQAFNSREIKKVFKFSDSNRLDHKEQIMFPVLQNLSSVKSVFCGHYYLVNLNLKAERFEVMDSMRKESDKQYREDSAKIVASIKTLWETNYQKSNINIQGYKTYYVTCPKQETTYDCGYCMLKNMENWDGRKMIPFDTNDMPSFRILYTKKWVQWSENKILWRKLLFED